MRALARLVLVWVLLVAAFGAQASASGATYTYDLNGNLTSKTEAGVLWTYRYDSRDLLFIVRRNGELVASYAYDHEGRRTSRTTPEGVVRYLWDGERIVAEQDESGRTIARYVYAGDRLIVVEHETEGRGAYLFDGLGSPVSLSRPDGTLAVRYRYDAWGSIAEQTGESANPFLFTSHLFDGITGLYYAKARYYDPVVGRFTAVDPFEGTAVEPRSQHPYQYAYANPTTHVDRDGRCVGDLQQRGPCQAISRAWEHFLVGDVLALAERDVEIHQKVVAGRRQFKRDFGRDPLPDDVVWSEGSRLLTADFGEIDTTGRAEAANLEWSLVSAGVGGRLAYSAARASGAAAGAALAAGTRQAADDAAGELVGVSPGDVGDLARLTRSSLPQGPRPPPAGVVTIGESAGRPGVDLVSIAQDRGAARASHIAAPSITRSSPEGTGSYRAVGGHHVHAKAAFRGHTSYDPKQGFSVSQDFMESRNWSHQDMTRTQYRLFKELGESGRPNSLTEHTRIAVEALQAGGATEVEARGLVALSLLALRYQGVRAPTRIPWVDKEP